MKKYFREFVGFLFIDAVYVHWVWIKRGRQNILLKFNKNLSVLSEILDMQAKHYFRQAPDAVCVIDI